MSHHQNITPSTIAAAGRCLQRIDVLSLMRKSK